MKNCIYPNGVYIYANGVLHIPETYNGTTGKIIVIMGSDAFEVSPEQIENATWGEAMNFAKLKGGNLPSKLQRIIMWEYNDQVQIALEKIGGTQLGEDWEWLCEEYSFYAWYFNGYNGYMSSHYKYNKSTGRPIFNFSLDTLAN